MRIIKNGFWDYAGRWAKSFKREAALHWQNDWIENGYCSDCRFCCGPQDSDTPFPMPLLPDQVGPETSTSFHLLDSRTPYIGAAGCKSDGPRGCVLSGNMKPVACRLFPIVFANGGLFLYQNCPAAIYTPLVKFMELARSSATMLMRYSFEDLLHLSLCLGSGTLADNYINLHITILKDGRKDLIFE